MKVALLSTVGLACLALTTQAQAQTTPNSQEWQLIQLTAQARTLGNNGSGVTVAVIDSRTQCNHTELTGRCTNVNLPGGVYTRNDVHGTHVAGLVAGRNHGVANAARIINYGIFDDRGYVNQLTTAWNSARSSGATINNMSFGQRGTGRLVGLTASELSTMASANMASMLFVKAAGNDSLNGVNESYAVNSTTAATALSRLIIVGSTTATGARSSFSNMPGEACLLASGQTTCTNANKFKFRFISAPGSDMYAAVPTNSLNYLSGTSMASPVVAGAAALLQGRWPALKNQPARTAEILFTSATDIGAAGVDAVYGWGLLNVTRALQSSGPTAVVASNGSMLRVDNRLAMSSGAMVGLTEALSEVVAIDQFGRDYSLFEVHNFQVSELPLGTLETAPMARVNALGSHADMASTYFAPVKTPMARASFGSSVETVGDSLSRKSGALQFALDMPMSKGGTAMFRLTGSGDTRANLATDPTLKPFSAFASSSLLSDSVMLGFASQPKANEKIVMYAATSTQGAYAPVLRQTLSEGLKDNGFGHQRDVSFDTLHNPRAQTGLGIGWFQLKDNGAVLGLSASVLNQKNGYYDMTSNLDAFAKGTTAVSVGVSYNQSVKGWDMFSAAELTHLKAPGQDGPIRLTDAALISGEVGARKTGVFLAKHNTLQDTFSVAVQLKPTAISGALELDYLGMTEDRMDYEAKRARVGMHNLTDRVLRLESAYAVSGDGYRVSLGAGADVSGKRPASLVSARFSTAF